MWPTGPTPAGMVVLNRSHALGSFAAVATSDHTVIMSCFQGRRITLRFALRSVQTGVIIEILLDLSATVLWRLETQSASNSAWRPRRNQLRWGTLSTSCASGDFRALGRSAGTSISELKLIRQCTDSCRSPFFVAETLIGSHYSVFD